MSNTWKTSNNRSTGARRSNTTRSNYGTWSNYGSGYASSYGTRTGSTSTNNAWSPNSPKFNPIKEECECRIGSYENIYTQCSGTGKTPFSPTTANKFVKFVNNGAYVYKFNSSEFRRFFGNSFDYTNCTPNTAFRYLKTKFGAGIKGVAQGKGNNWLICASSNVSARPFTNYDWK